MYSINRGKTAVRVMTTMDSNIPDLIKGFGIKTVRVPVGEDVFLWTTADTDMKMGYILGLMDANKMTKVPVGEWTEAWKAAKEIREELKSDSETKSDSKKAKKAPAKKAAKKPAAKKATKKAAAKKAKAA